MTPDDRIDFSSIDPARDGQRWERMIQATTARALAARHTISFAQQVVSWARPTIALAASITLVAGGFALTRTNRAASTDGAFQLLEWAHQGTVPADQDVTRLFGRME